MEKLDIRNEMDEVCSDVYKWAKSKGWWDDKNKNIPELLCLIHSEVTEALEEYRDSKMETYFEENGKPCGFYSELADVVIRIMDVFGKDNVSLTHEIGIKMDYNETRPYRHGGKIC